MNSGEINTPRIGKITKLLFKVQDSGAGIKAENLDKLFKMFT